MNNNQTETSLLAKYIQSSKAVDPHSLYSDPDPDPAVFLNADPDPGLACGRLSVQELTHGASACQLSPPLPPLNTRNTPAAFTHRQQVTDNIVGWIKAGFTAGPFKAPPLPDFRCNPILAVPQPGKVRVLLNLSAPDGASYNDNVNAREGPDVHCPASGLHYCPVRPWSPHLEIRHARRV